MTALAPRDAYRLWAPTYATETAISLIEDDLARELSPPLAGKRLLDAGCGTGRRLLGVNASFAAGIDASPEMLRSGQADRVAAADCAPSLSPGALSTSSGAGLCSAICRISKLRMTSWRASARPAATCWSAIFTRQRRRPGTSEAFAIPAALCMKSSTISTMAPRISRLPRDRASSCFACAMEPSAHPWNISMHAPDAMKTIAGILACPSWPVSVSDGNRPMRILIEAANTTIAVEDGRIVEPSGSFDRVVRAPKGEVRRGLINAHDHLHRNHYGRLGAPPYANAYEWARDIQSRNRIEIARGRELPRREALLHGAWKNLIAGVTHAFHHDDWEPDFEIGFPLNVIKLPTADSLGMTPAPLMRPAGPFAMHVAEGVDAAAAEEIRELDRRGFLTPDFMAVHAVGADDDGVIALRRAGCAVIWCPSSNRFLFGRTACRGIAGRRSRRASWHGLAADRRGNDSGRNADGTTGHVRCAHSGRSRTPCCAPSLRRADAVRRGRERRHRRLKIVPYWNPARKTSCW